jgi:DNA-binding NarL/FixJ family response regulator
MIVDDHPVVRIGLAWIIGGAADMELVGEAADGTEAIPKAEEVQPDVLILDLRMPELDGLATLRSLTAAKLRSKILILTASEDKNEYIEAMKLGCSGIVLKSIGPELLLKSIRKVHGGEIWLDSHTTAAVMRQFASPSDSAASRAGSDGRAPVSQREREIVALVAQGHKNKDIADKLFISEQTVKNHLHNIFDKLKVSDRLELALYAIHTGLHQAPARMDQRGMKTVASTLNS